MYMINLRKILSNRDLVREKSPLIHAITNPIAINMVANAILFQGAKAICAEHPDEMEDIVKISDSLSVNLGNITDSRIKSIELAVKFANKKNIPVIIDLVGVGASKLRYDFAKKLLENYKFSLIKGNGSEILAISGNDSNAKGIDVGEKDKTNGENIEKFIEISKDLCQKYQTSVLITGKTDILVGEKEYFLIENGCENLSKITATGCMLTSLISTFLSVTNPIEASILGLLILEISGEISDRKELYSFFVNLMDNISIISDDEICKRAKIREGKF
ncbi:hydroxyethylthiazole kinase [Anaerococcus hydrogenalis]|uniref:Hydroxyethylthiazole kinase n=2 Tax=Anaerococcus hydrogenalis TaxID=33029 RepID=A0A2N6UGX4_9FIRM|nr:hydroxyethylthiazole kinase [Anaerococcus hydrogenalis]MDK7695684.1 hydroxyethylthiazole kinase [Anaerococcus hydrogenalis]MDK7697493.1 hydroxyethylthiazole kinase [Anaerococcus hydrogenalis]MDK7708760.1 hydroxyethylthiazole kinase [Anaerococcus hydrogenalis]PMC80805.1 hydroxyethylthiazole kinase [Anaerococcus hydrogenalis]